SDPVQGFHDENLAVAAFGAVPEPAVPGGQLRTFSNAGVLPRKARLARGRQACERIQRVSAPDRAEVRTDIPPHLIPIRCDPQIRARIGCETNHSGRGGSVAGTHRLWKYPGRVDSVRLGWGMYRV